MTQRLSRKIQVCQRYFVYISALDFDFDRLICDFFATDVTNRQTEKWVLLRRGMITDPSHLSVSVADCTCPPAHTAASASAAPPAPLLAFQCLRCGANSYKTSIGAQEFTGCPPMSRTFQQGPGGGGDAECVCACVPGSTRGVDGCTACAPGFCKNGTGNERCEECPVGKFSPGNLGSAAADACIECGTGTYARKTGMSSCVLCPQGSFQSMAGRSVCVQCDVGLYSAAAGASVCTACPAGSFSAKTGTADWVRCLYGTYAAQAGMTACADCAAGTFAMIQSTTCVDCAAGKYAQEPKMTACLSCTSEYAQVGSSKVVAC